jgi:acyl-CoA oxidase
MVLFNNYSKIFEMQEYLKKFPDLFQVEIPQSWEKNRELTDKQFYKILEKNFISVDDYTKTDNLWTLTELLHYINPSLAIKFGVDIILFGGAIHFLGTQKHNTILQEIISGNKIGCFAMTEIGHGSNLKGLRTTAKKIGNKLIINTKDDEAVKCWIGGATKADYSVVFCQLFDEETNNQGLHAIVVPMKLKGIECVDMGSKIGLNGVDNGFLRFNNVEVPLDNLLDKYGGFNEKGEYITLIKNKDIRFSKMLSALSVGRISIAIGSYAISYKAFIIALKYNLKRKQFKIKGEQEEKRIFEYSSQISKFINIFSCLYHMRLGIFNLINMYKENGVNKDLHSIGKYL